MDESQRKPFQNLLDFRKYVGGMCLFHPTFAWKELLLYKLLEIAFNILQDQNL